MAHGMKCRKCGFQETDHEFPENFEGKKPCSDFTLSQKDMEKSERIWEAIEKQEAKEGGGVTGNLSIIDPSTGLVYDGGD